MVRIPLILLFISFCFGSSCSERRQLRVETLGSARTNIAAALPTGWRVVRESEDQAQLTSAYFTGSSNKALVIVGPNSNHVDWTDRQGLTHSEQLARECLYIWIVPSDFKPNFPKVGSYLYFFGTDLPKPIYSSKYLSVFGMVSHYVDDTNRLSAILKEAIVISSPSVQPSWRKWMNEIQCSFHLKDGKDR